MFNKFHEHIFDQIDFRYNKFLLRSSTVIILSQISCDWTFLRLFFSNTAELYGGPKNGETPAGAPIAVALNLS
jgi:hypothetical protein